MDVQSFGATALTLIRNVNLFADRYLNVFKRPDILLHYIPFARIPKLSTPKINLVNLSINIQDDIETRYYKASVEYYINNGGIIYEYPMHEELGYITKLLALLYIWPNAAFFYCIYYIMWRIRSTEVVTMYYRLAFRQDVDL
jgi:hypothetical protein